MFTVDSALFRDDAIPAELREQNDQIIALANSLPEAWLFPPALLRKARREGKGIFLPEPAAPNAETITVPGPGGKVPLRVIRPTTRPSRGAYLHIHGGGWVLGAADFQDGYLARSAEATGLTSVSVEYRLAPESPYPAAPDDCEAAALWLTENAVKEFGGPQMIVGGESAGAHLSVVTLLRLRDRHGLKPFAAALLNAGCFDLGLTPSARAFGEEKLVLRTSDIRHFVSRYLAGGGDPGDPDVSPLYADVAGLPPALFTCGTRDALIDDTLLMAGHWTIAGNGAALDIVPGGCHFFTGLKSNAADAAMARMEAFVNAQLDG